MPLEHAQPGFNPSSLSRTKACPGSPKEIAKLPPEARDTTTQAAIDGTRRHALAEWAAGTGKGPKEWPQKLGEWVFTPDDFKAVEKVWPYLRDHPARTKGGLWKLEETLEIGKWCGLPEGAQVVDAIAVTEGQDSFRCWIKRCAK